MSAVAELERDVTGLPDGWRSSRLGDVARLGGGTTPARGEARYWDGASVPWATPSDITSLPTGVNTIAGTESMVSDRALAECSLPLNPPGTVLMTSRATIGFAAINTVPMTTNQGFITFTAGRDIDAEFLLQWLIAQRPNLVAAAGGSTFKELSRGTAKLLPIDLPPLDEQRRIAEVLRSVDEAIAANEIALQQRDRIRKGFGTLFKRGIGHSNFKPSAIGTIPALWQISTMNDVCHNVGVGIASSATHAYVDQGVPLLRNQNIKPGHLDLQDLLFVTEEYDRSYATKRVRTGDIITMRTGYPGRSAVIPPELDGCQTFTTLISRPKTSLVDPAFLCAWINSEPGMVEIRKRQAGGAQQNLNASAMKQVPVPLPPLEEQRQIAGLLSNFPTEDDALISNLRNTRKLIQADLLSGRVRVPEYRKTL